VTSSATASRAGWMVVVILLVAFWIYDKFIAPIVGLPTLDR
jgi:hypothetical protein